MKEIGIIFNKPMVRAIMKPGDPKTQTRRLKGLDYVNSRPDVWKVAHAPRAIADATGWFVTFECIGESTDDWHPGLLWTVRSPYGKPGDRLWVRESFQMDCLNPGKVDWRADRELETVFDKWTPSIHMPRAITRIWLEVVNIRLERLQQISEQDARAEGIVSRKVGSARTGLCPVFGLGEDDDYAADAVGAYEFLWDSINSKRAPWKFNPWVWVVEFKRIPE